jgi:hypothetical protein
MSPGIGLHPDSVGRSAVQGLPAVLFGLIAISVEIISPSKFMD